MDEQTEKAPEVKTDAQVIIIATAEQLSWQTINSTMLKNVDSNSGPDAIILKSLHTGMPSHWGTFLLEVEVSVQKEKYTPWPLY